MDSFIQASLFEQQFSLGTIAAVFAAGLLTSLTPCVYPMLPITVSIIGSQARGRTQSILYSLLYVFGLALVYALQLMGMLQWTVRVTIETENNMKVLDDLLPVLKGKKTKIVLYSYDSFLFDFHKEDGIDFIKKMIEA